MADRIWVTSLMPPSLLRGNRLVSLGRQSLQALRMARLIVTIAGAQSAAAGPEGSRYLACSGVIARGVPEPIAGDARLPGVDHGKPFPRRRHDPLRTGEHLQVCGLDLHAIAPPIPQKGPGIPRRLAARLG